MTASLLRKFTFILLLSVGFGANAQKKDVQLTERLNELVRKFHGQVGIYVRHLKTGQVLSINGDSIFPTASMIKIPIAIGVFDKLEKGELEYHAQLIYKDSLLYPGVDILGSFRDGEKIELNKVITLMLTMSDNTASLWCQHLAGTGTMINQWLASNGFEKTRVNSKTPGRERDREKFGWGQTSPREMAEIMARLHEGKVISTRTSERIYRTLSRNYWDAHGLSHIPPYIQVASKNGAVDASRSEVVLVNNPHGPYVYCVITKNQQDYGWDLDSEGFVLLQNVSKILWEYFEPGDKWSPPEGQWR
jgi:beta-lactamase class A